MLINRRQFLILAGSFSGFGLATCTRQVVFNSPNNTLANETMSNHKADANASKRDKISLAVISDLNSQYGSTSYEPEVGSAIALILTQKPDLVLCGGDAIAAQKNSLSDAQIKAMWEAFDRHIAAPLRQAKIPFGFTIGNHDGSGAVAGGKLTFERDRQLASAYWQDPKRASGLQFVDRSGYPFYYTFAQNEIFYLVWDASTSIIPAQQILWAEKSLASSTAQNAKLRIAIGHLPLIPVAVGRDDPGNFLSSGEKLRSLLERYRVSTYISGHHHAYFPGKKGNLELLYAGALGSGPRQLLNNSLPARKTLTFVDITLASETVTYTTYDMRTMTTIALETLPSKIVTPNGTVFRRDLISNE
jgi:hypothetical protein